MELLRHTALVTGAGRGIGRAIALELARCGARVVVVSRDSERVWETCAAVEAGSGTAIPLCADIVSPDFTALLDRCLNDEGTATAEGPLVDIVVHNACVYAPYGRLETLHDDEWMSVFETVVHAPMRIDRHVLPGMKKAGYGRIIRIGSMAASLGAKGQSAYSSAKSALLGLARTIALEAGPFGVTSNLLELGLIDSERVREAVKPEILENIIACTAARRPGTTEEVAKVVAFLASPGAGFINGACLPVSGGLGLGVYSGGQGVEVCSSVQDQEVSGGRVVATSAELGSAKDAAGPTARSSIGRAP